jgi:hypothetical protein
MQFFEGIIAIILSTFLLISMITVSQSIKTRFKKLEKMKTDIALESIIAEIPIQNLGDAEALLSETIRILNSNRVRWIEIELLSDKNGRITVENSEVLNHPGRQDTRCIRIIRVSDEDTLRIVVSVEND